MSNGNAPRENWQSLIKLSIHLPSDPRAPFPGLYTREMNIYVYTHTHTHTHTHTPAPPCRRVIRAALFILAQTGNSSNTYQQGMGKQIHTVWCFSATMEWISKTLCLPAKAKHQSEYRVSSFIWGFGTGEMDQQWESSQPWVSCASSAGYLGRVRSVFIGMLLIPLAHLLVETHRAVFLGFCISPYVNSTSEKANKNFKILARHTQLKKNCPQNHKTKQKRSQNMNPE